MLFVLASVSGSHSQSLDFGLTCISLPMIASSIAIHSTIHGINGYSSLQISAKCFPVTTPNLAAKH